MNSIEQSNRAARATWERKAVGSQRAGQAEKGSLEYFERIRTYRYGYETPFIPSTFRFHDLDGKRVLEIGVGNGIDAIEMMRNGAVYTGLDITRNHLDLTRRLTEIEGLTSQLEGMVEGDLLGTELPGHYDVIYSFGVLHHIAHEDDYLRTMHALLSRTGERRIAVYAKWSFFNAYLAAGWLLKNRMRNSFDDWRSHISEYSELGHPVTIKIRTRREVEKGLLAAGFRVVSYERRGFVQGYMPLIGKRLAPDGWVLATFGSILGWYHCFIAWICSWPRIETGDCSTVYAAGPGFKRW